MSENPIYDVRVALATALRDRLQWPMRIIGENTDIPIADQVGTWARMTNFPSAIVPKTLGNGGQDEYEGYMTLDVFVPEGTGDKALLSYASQVVGGFPAGTRLVYNGLVVRIQRVEPDTIQRPEAGATSFISVHIYWATRLTRNLT